jgi:type I restriction enzyme S subunit
MMNGKIPKGWSSRPLADCGRWVSGGTPRRSEPSYWGGDIPWISAKSLKVFDLDDSDDRVTKEGSENGTTLVPPGTILFVVRGMSLANEFRVGVACREVTFNQDLRGIVPAKDIDSRFLARFLRHAGQVVLSQVDNAAHGTKRLPTERLRALEVPLPHLAEQKRIAVILDQADAIQHYRREAIETVADLCPGIFHEMFGSGNDVGAYEVEELGTHAEVVSGVTKGRRFNGQPTVMLPYLRVANVQDGLLDLSKIKKVEALPSDLKKLRLEPGDVLMTEGGDHDKLGRGALWDGQIDDCIHQNHIFRVRVDRGRLTPVFFAHFLRTPFAKAYFLRCAKKTTNLATINMRQLRALPVPLPSIRKQEQFGIKVEAVRHLAEQHDAALEQSEELCVSLLQRAFKGEL